MKNFLKPFGALLGPVGLGSPGGIIASVGMGLRVTGMYPHGPIYAGLILLMTGCAWEWRNGRVANACAIHACELGVPPGADIPHMGQRIVSGATLSVAAAGVFFGLAQSVGARCNFAAGSNDHQDFLHDCPDAPCLV